MTKKKMLETLNEGDDVVLRSRAWYGDIYGLTKITKGTKHYLDVGPTRFRRDTGYAGPRWDSDEIFVPTEELLLQVARTECYHELLKCEALLQQVGRAQGVRGVLTRELTEDFKSLNEKLKGLLRQLKEGKGE